MELLAILGRGVQRKQGSDSWMTTGEWELCASDFSHIPERELGAYAPDDYNPRCIVGGGSSNIEAGLALIKRHAPKIVVCAYGPRAPYLERVNGPSESEVMSKYIREEMRARNLPTAEVVEWPRTRTMSERSNTFTELKNIYELANERRAESVGIVTVTVHLPRVMTMMARHLDDAKFTRFSVVYYASELVLAEEDPKKFAPIALQLFRSLAFGRTAALELSGTTAFLENRY